MDSKSGIYLNVSSPESQLLGQMVNSVSLPGIGGRFCILHDHAPLISALEEGDIEYIAGDVKKTLHVRSGFVEVSDNTVSVCVEI